MTSRHYSSDAKEVNILIVVGCFLKLGLNFGVFNIAIYGKTVRCSFNSFEQCIYSSESSGASHFTIFKKDIPDCEILVNKSLCVVS